MLPDYFLPRAITFSPASSPGYSFVDPTICNSVRSTFFSTMGLPGLIKVTVWKSLLPRIREVMTQVAIYAGVPCGVDAFRIAREAFKEVETATA
jgi:hypothetical protein